MSFDLVPYLGLTAATDVTNDREVQASAYEELHKVADPQQWSELTEHNAYMQQMKTDPSLFSRDLGDYRIKWGYVGLARALSWWVAPYTALRIITLASLVIFLGATIYLLWSANTLQSLFFIGPVLMAGGINYDVGSTTPDVLALALAALLLIGWLRPFSWVVVIVSVCCVSVRPDMIFLIAGIFAASILFGRNRVRAGLALVCSAILFAGERFATPYAGWWQHVSVPLYGSTAVISGAPPFSLSGYIAAWLWQLVRIAATGTYLYVIILLLLAYVGLSKRSTSPTEPHDIVFYGAVIGLIGRMIAFPTIEPRFFLPTLFIMSVLLANRLRPDFSKGMAFAIAAIRRRVTPIRQGS